MKRYLLMLLAVIGICGATFGAMAVEAQSLIEPALTTQAAADSSSVSIISDRMFIFGVTVGVMASICTLVIVLMVCGNCIAPTEEPKRKLRLKRT